jgi:parvulin-like peptidyl-prolyl isomerase
MSKNPSAPRVTRKQESRAHHDRQMRRYIRISAIVVALLVMGVIAFGLVDQFVLQPGRAVATVNGAKISTSDFEKQVRYTRMQMIQQYWQLKQYSQYFGASQFQTQLTQIETEFATPEAIGQQALNNLISSELILQEAKKRNISASSAEVEQKIQEAFSYYPNGTPTPAPTGTPEPTSTLVPTRAGVPTATSTPMPTATATLSPTETATPGPTPTATALPTITPTPTPFTPALFNRDWKDAKGRIYSASGMTDADVHRIFEVNLLRTKLTDIWDATPQIASVNARHILVSGQVTATDIIKQLQAGADFAQLAAKYSEDPGSKDSGGDLGYFSKGQMQPEFEAAAFGNPVGLILTPVQSVYGYHVIEVLDKRLETMDEARQRALSDWLAKAVADPLIVTKDDAWWKSHVPTVPAFSTDTPPTPYPTSKP